MGWTCTSVARGAARGAPSGCCLNWTLGALSSDELATALLRWLIWTDLSAAGVAELGAFATMWHL